MKPLYVFLIQPFRLPHATPLYEWIRNTCKVTDGEFEVFRADEPAGNVAQPRLQDRIDACIKRADICIADLTESKEINISRNQNVLLEVGAAYALQKPVIPISNPDFALPSDISNNIYIELDPKLMSDNKENYEKIRDKFCKELRQKLFDSRQSIRGNSPPQFMAYGYETREKIDFYPWVKRSVKRIWILTTNLEFFVADELSGESEDGEMTILEMIKRELPNKPNNFELSILTLDPDSNFTNERAKSLGRDKREFREDLRTHLSIAEEFINSEECCRKAQLRIYDVHPLQITFFFDDYVISSVVADGKSSRECVAYLHNLAVGGAHDSYEPHFRHLWHGSTIIATNRRDGRSRRGGR